MSGGTKKEVFFSLGSMDKLLSLGERTSGYFSKHLL